jgi:hypothetical protein
MTDLRPEDLEKPPPIRMLRGWMDARIFAREPYCRGSAWLWLVENAAEQDRRIDHEGRTHTLKKGQLIHSQKFMAKAWRWPTTNVERFIDRLKADAMIETEKLGKGMIITICNYSQYEDADGIEQSRPIR